MFKKVLKSLKRHYKKLVSIVKKIPPGWQTTGLVVTASLIYFRRAQVYILQPQLYADDSGSLQGGFNDGLRSLSVSVSGFFHLIERLFGLLVSQLSLHYAPFLFNLAAGLMFVLLAYYLFSPRTKLFSSFFERLFMLLLLG